MVIAFAITGLHLILYSSRLTGNAFGKNVERTDYCLLFSALIENNIPPFNSSEYKYQMCKSVYLLLNLNFVSANSCVHALIGNRFCWSVTEISCLALLIFPLSGIYLSPSFSQQSFSWRVVVFISAYIMCRVLISEVVSITKLAS
jgi:hypothetical protein